MYKMNFYALCLCDLHSENQNTCGPADVYIQDLQHKQNLRLRMHVIIKLTEHKQCRLTVNW